MSNNLLAKDFSAIDGLNIEHEIEKLSFKVHKEPLVAETAHVPVNKAVVLRSEDNCRIGIVNADRPDQNHGDTMRWFVGQLQDTGVAFKLKNSVLSEKDLSLYQEYVLDYAVTPPDGELLNAMIIVRMSFIGKPFSAHFGTFRFACSNGILVGRTIAKLDIKAKEFTNFAQMTLSEAVRRNLEAYKGIEALYKKIQDADLEAKVETIFGDNGLPIKCKKSALEKLEGMGVLTVFLDGDNSGHESFVRRLRRPHFDNIKEYVRFSRDTDLWTVYNLMTGWATRETKSEATRMLAWATIDEVFSLAVVSA